MDAGKLNNLVVRIEAAKDIGRTPAHYPSDAAGEKPIGKEDLDAWFEDVTEWWQSPLIEAPNTFFTHGRRLKLHDGKHNADQLEAISRILRDAQRTDNGRAVATLVDPETDTLGPAGGASSTFPAFCLLQLHISSGGAKDQLNATAYFRKQEMRYWWPVNVAEIRLIMGNVAAQLKNVEIGSITTVTALAVSQKSRARVSIPKIDRLYLGDDGGRASLLRLDGLDLTEEGPDRFEWVVPPVLEETDRRRSHQPVARVRQTAPRSDMVADLVDDGGRVVLL